MKHVQYYLDKAGSSSLNSKYAAFLGAQESAVIHYGKSANGDIGNVW